MTLLALQGVSFGQGSAPDNLFNQLNFTVSAGECHCICGVTGVGKSTLLQLMAMPTDFDYQGKVIHSPNLCLGLVMQDPNVQLIRESIGAEVAFGLENLAYPAMDMIAAVEQALDTVGLDLPLETLVSHLSLGQKYRLMLAAQLVLKPNIILIDEPWAQLDNVGVKELNFAIERLISSGVSVVMTEHHSDAFTRVIDTYWRLEEGRLKQHFKQQSAASNRIYKNRIVKPSVAEAIKYPHETQLNLCENRLTIFPLTIQFSDSSPILEISQTLHLMSGEIVGIFGENGSGKSSLLNQIVGIDDSNKADLLMLGKSPKLGIFGKELGFLMQRPSRQLFELTVLQELEFSLKRFDLPLSHASEMLAQLDISHLAPQSPHKLSYGQQHLVALASVLCVQPKVLLLDDPFAGLDDQYYAHVINVLKHFSQQGGSIIFTSHRPILENVINKCWKITNKKLIEQRFSYLRFSGQGDVCAEQVAL